MVDPPVWNPPPEVVADANATRFALRHGIDGFDALVRRSIDDPEWFWDAVVDWLGVRFDVPYTRVLDESRGPEWATWFTGGMLNLTWNCVDRHLLTDRRDRDAVRFEAEDGSSRALTYGELAVEVSRLADGLDYLGVRQGDRVALVLPMTPEVVVAFYAVARIGAVV